MISLFSKRVPVHLIVGVNPTLPLPIMKSALFLGFGLASASDDWVDDDLSLLQTRAVVQSGGDPPVCHNNVHYGSGPMVDGNANANNNMDCNARCAERTDCAFWDIGQGTCRLRSSAGASGATYGAGFFGGARGCRFAPTTRPCEQAQVAYHSGPMVNGNAGGSSGPECRARCNADARCYFWDFGDDRCRLRSAEGSAGAQGAGGYVAGAKFCTEPPATTTTTTEATTTTQIIPDDVPVGDEASAVGDPHILTSSGSAYDLATVGLHRQ